MPLYFQIAENLRAAIEDGELRPGDRLENEIQLSERLGVSRPTVRQAIQRLAHAGLVVRQRGVGTVVSRRVQRRLAISSLYDDLRAAGRQPLTVVLSAGPVLADQDVAAALDVKPGTTVLMIERLRVAEALPVAVMRNYLPDGLLPADAVGELARTGLYETLRQRGVRIHSADDIIGARRATAAEARLLRAGRGCTVLTMRRMAADRTGRVVEYGMHAYLAARYSFRIALGPDDRG